MVNRASASYRGEGKPTPGTPLSPLIRPGCDAICASCMCWIGHRAAQLLSSYRGDLAADRTHPQPAPARSATTDNCSASLHLSLFGKPD